MAQAVQAGCGERAPTALVRATSALPDNVAHVTVAHSADP